MNQIQTETRNSELGNTKSQLKQAEPRTRLLARSAFWLPGSEFVILVGFSLLLFTQGISSRSLWASHEARAAQNAQMMLESGDWLLPRLFDGSVELQKPVGYYWCVALLSQFTGQVNEITVRLPAILSGMFVVLAVWWWLRQQCRPTAALVAGICLASFVHFTGTARIGRIDIPLTACVTGMLLTLHQPLSDRRLIQWLVPTVFGALALLLKGPIGLVLVASVWFLYRLTARTYAFELGRISNRTQWLVFLGSVLLALPWYLAVHQATDGEFTKVFFWYHHINRALGGAEALASHPWWFYGARLLFDLMPWTPLAVIALWNLPKRDATARLGADWFIVMLLIFSASRFKRADYLLPAYPGLAIVIGCWAERLLHRITPVWQQRFRWSFVTMALLMPVGWYVFDHYVTAPEQARKDPARFAEHIRSLTPQPESVILFRTENHLLAYQLGRPVRTLTQWEDLEAVWQQEPNSLVVMREEEANSLPEQIRQASELVASSRAFSEVIPFRPMILLRRTP